MNNDLDGSIRGLIGVSTFDYRDYRDYTHGRE
jgi:hypothetical protein